ncbi:MAG: hypothetical protein ACYDA9_17795 [Terriglobia bacterium]
MKLRDHPKLGGKWPPKWGKTHIATPYKTHPRGEQGVLKKVEPYHHASSGHLTLFIKYEGEEHDAKISLNDIAFLRVLCNKLTECVGMPLPEIGSIELDF